MALRFKNGRGTVLPALRGYICHVRVDGNSVASVSYALAAKAPDVGTDGVSPVQLDQLRAATTAAVQHGVFRIDDQQGGSELAKYIHTCKRLDPTLGLYAAYAFSQANSREQVQSGSKQLAQSLEIELFDVAMLARKLGEQPSNHFSITPFCPMLTRGWSLLRAFRVELPKVLDDAQDELEPGLWTTFKPDRMRLIFEELEKGKL